MSMHEHESDPSRANLLRLRRMGIDTYQEPVVYMRADCAVCRSEGFEAQSRVSVTVGRRTIIATLNVVHEYLLQSDEAGLSEAGWNLLTPAEGDLARMSHPEPLESFRYVRGKVFGATLTEQQVDSIIQDVAARRYSDIHLSAFITACGGGRLNIDEVTGLTRAMVGAGDTLTWDRTIIADKHCVGGLPGNRTTPIVVAIAAAAGLCIPKTSSRAITSPAGTADAMETIAPVNLSLAQMRRVVEKEGGCVVWGGSVQLSPADDVLIRVERILDVDAEGQMVASVLSKKVAAGSTHLIIDIPVGPTAKVRSRESAESLASMLSTVAGELGIKAEVLLTDGTQPVGRGIGPALEARDVLSVLRNEPGAPMDLCNRALELAGGLLELSGAASNANGVKMAREILNSGRAWTKFQAICEAQGGMREPPVATHRHEIVAFKSGIVYKIDNRRLALIAKLAGAPRAPAAGVTLLAKLETPVDRGQPLFTVHAETPGQLAYALEYLNSQKDIIELVSA